MNKNLIENEDYQIVTPSNNGLFTVSRLNTESPSNSGLLEDFQNVDTIPQLPFSTNSCFDGNDLPKIETLDSLLSHLCELMIRFDGCVKDYQKSDFEHLVKTVTNSLIYLYSNNTTNTGSFVVGFMGIANKDTNPYLEAIAANNKYPGIYFAQEFGNYPHFGVDVTNNELFNSIVLLIPNINSSGVVLNYEKSIYNLQISNSYNSITTPPLQDSSTKIATTEFVAKQINQSPIFGNVFIDEYKFAGHKITTGNNNVGIGTSALAWTDTGSFNVAFGWLNLSSNTSGSENSGFGRGCLWKHPAGNRNNAFGRNALYELLTGNDNIGIGAYAATNIQSGALCNSLSKSIVIGNYARAKANGDTNEIIIGDSAIGEGSHTVVLGNTAIVKTFLRGQLDVKATSPVLAGSSISIFGGEVQGVGTNFRAFAAGDILRASFNLFNEASQEWEPFEGFFTIQSINDNNRMYVSNAGSLEVSGITDFSISRTSATKSAIDTFMGSHKMIGAEFNVNASVVPQYDAFYNVGNSVRRFNQVFAANSTISTSDARTKTEIAAFTPDELNAAKQLSKEIGTYKFLSAIAEKGDRARLHVGMTVQRAIEIMQANNLNPFAYGFICFDKWDDEFVTIPAVEGQEAFDEPLYEYTENEQGEMQQVQVGVKHHEAIPPTPERTEQVQTAGELYSFRYTELLAFISRGFEARLTALEEN